MKHSLSENIFNIFNILFMLLVIVITLYPLYYVLCASFSNNSLLSASPGFLFKPLGFNAGAYTLAFKHPLLLSGYKNILLILVFALPLNIIMTLRIFYGSQKRNVQKIYRRLFYGNYVF